MDRVLGEQPGYAGSDRDRDPQAHPMPHELEEIRSFQRVTPCHHQLRGRVTERPNLPEEGLRFPCAQFPRVSSLDRLGPTVLAGKGACPRELPVDERGGIGEEKPVRSEWAQFQISM